MHTLVIIQLVSFALGALGIPTLAVKDTGCTQGVTFIHPATEPASKSTHAPATLSIDDKAFLNKFQPLTNGLTGGQDVINGWCYAEYPCHSINNPAAVEISSVNGSIPPTINPSEFTELLNLVLASNITQLRPSIFRNVSSISITTGKAELSLFAFHSGIASTIVAGAAFDLYKIFAGDNTTNAIRGVQVENKFTLCLTPFDADRTSALNFCLGRELNGALPPMGEMSPIQKQKRDLVLGLACGLLGPAPILGGLLAGPCSQI